MHRKRGSAAVTGQYQHTIDAKGRLFIPAKLREELGDTFYVTMGMDSCLSIYSDASWARFTEKFESLPYTKTKAMRPLFANAAKCEPDSQGRIVVPAKLRKYAGLEKDAVIIGVNDRAEICFLQEFGCNQHRYDPYAQGDTPVFRDEKPLWF